MVNNFLTNIKVEDIARFQDELFEFIDNTHPEIIESIHTTKDLKPENAEAIKAAINEFKGKFVASK